MRWPRASRRRNARSGAAERAGRRAGAGGRQGAPAAGQPAKRLAAQTSGTLRLGTYRPIWAAPEVELSPALHYTIAEQTLELSPQDAARLGVLDGEEVEVAAERDAAARSAYPCAPASSTAPRSSPTGIAADSANALTEPLVEVKRA